MSFDLYKIRLRPRDNLFSEPAETTRATICGHSRGYTDQTNALVECRARLGNILKRTSWDPLQYP